MRFTYCPDCGTKLIQKEVGDEGFMPYCDNCKKPLFDMFSSCIIALVTNEKQEVALLRQNYISTDYYNLVSGYMKPGETAEETAVREVGEELGLTINEPKITGTYWFDKKDMITGEDLKAGDVLIGMASSGVHSNGFSLVRKVFEMTKESLDTYYDDLGTTLGEALLAPTRIYVKALKSIKNAGVKVKACSHITGGGFYENIPRMLKDGVKAVVEKDSYPVPPIFTKLAKEGNVDEHAMYNTYNMGIGMIVAVDPADVDKTIEAIKATGDTPYVIGHIEDGEKGVTLC